MNIFILDGYIKKNAQYYVDKHIVKIPLEIAQMLCTAHHVNGSEQINHIPYKPTHINHPINRWVREDLQNYNYTCNLGLALCEEYTYRYEKIHKCEQIIKFCLNHKPNIKSNKWNIESFIQAMPDKYKSNYTVLAYRNYYNGEKQHLFSWKKRNIPFWANHPKLKIGSLIKDEKNRIGVIIEIDSVVLKQYIVKFCDGNPMEILPQYKIREILA